MVRVAAVIDNQPTTVTERFHRVCKLSAEQTAVVQPREVIGGGPDRILTYERLDRLANVLAHELISRGLEPGHRVAVYMQGSIEMVVALVAVLKAGGCYVPLDPGYPEARLRFMLDDTEPHVVLTEAAIADRAPSTTVPVMVVTTDDDGRVLEAPSIGGTADSAAYIIYTSGSTGTPKGVVVPHRGITRLVVGSSYTRLDATRRFLQLAPTSFDAATLEIWGPLLNSGTCVLYPGSGVPDPGLLGRTIEAHGVNALWLTASLFNMLVDTRPEALTGVEELMTGGEALSVAHIRKALALLPNTQLINGYGPTESTTFTTCYRIPRSLPDYLTSIPIGQAIHRTQVLIVDPDTQREVAPGAEGELLIGGDGLALGYWNRSELTEERFVQFGHQRVYRTGDRVRRRPDGNIEFLGRYDDQVKIRGFRIEPGEVQKSVLNHPQVRQVVVDVRDDEAGKRLIAYVVADSEEFEIPSLRAWLAERVPDYMMPSALVRVSELPLTPNGKVDRARLPAPSSNRPDLSQAYAPPRNALERALVDLWAEALQLDQVGVHDRFFELGGTSIVALRFVAQLERRLKTRIPVVSFFDAPTIAQIAEVLRRDHPEATADEFGPDLSMPDRRSRPLPGRARPARRDDEPIAVTGMGGRFPGSPDVKTFWTNLRRGFEARVEISKERLRAAGVPEDLIADPDYVPFTYRLGDIDKFDAKFFGYRPREVELMDPHQRLFLEAAFFALEDAAHDPERFDGLIGVYGGVGRNAYMYQNIASHRHYADRLIEHALQIGNERDFPATHVAYRLNLRGPAINVQTACSTSGVAMHLARRALLVGECDLALAGGAKMLVPQDAGHLYVEGGPLAPDGRVHAFGAGARGMVRGSGAAAVVLRRLSDALRDGDQVYALLVGSAVNNDAARRAGFAAPSATGQAEVIAAAMADALVEPDSISYVEAHGTGTALGDPIEVEGLTRAYRAHTDRVRFCALGSVKTNIGHLDAGATAAGVIKTALAMQHEELPPSLNATEPNPQIDWDRSPFFVNTELRPWPKGDTPRRAGVSSFGLGGTNCHLILQEAPDREASGPSRAHQLLLWSAKTDEALEAMTANLARHLSGSRAALADVAFTLAAGRRRYAKRRMLVASSLDDAAAVLAAADRRRLISQEGADTHPLVAFMFPGGGTQYVDMARQLYDREEAFRSRIDRHAAVVERIMGTDFRGLIYPQGDREQAQEVLQQPSKALVALFAVEHALAELWMAWGVEPAMFIGHSMGEYTAACLADVFSPDDAMALVACRGRLFETLGPGSMLGVAKPESEVRALAERFGLDIAASNRPDSCVVSGATEAIESMSAQLEAQGIESRRIRINVAAHSRLVEPILSDFHDFVSTIELRCPQRPVISNVTGEWLTAEQAQSPQYWVDHLRSTVRFSDGLRTLFEKAAALVEVGPGQTLATFARQHPDRPPGVRVVTSVRHPNEVIDDQAFLLNGLGRLWLSGVDIDFSGFYAGEKRRRVSLPAYPLDRRSYWVAPPVSAQDEDRVVDGAALQTASRAAHSIQKDPAPVEAALGAVEQTEAPPANRQQAILGQLQQIVHELSGISKAEIDPNATFIELGFDSLFLTQANTAFKRAFKLRLTTRQLMEKTPNLDELASYLDEQLPADASTAGPTPAAGPTRRSEAPKPKSSNGVSKDSPWQPVAAASGSGLSDRQHVALDALIAEMNRRMPNSKQRTQKHRARLADPRTVQNFRQLWKGLVFPIISDYARGSRIRDVDGNEYIDLVCGYGSNFLGHHPEFVYDEIREQLNRTMAIGPQTVLAGEVAELICELTGMQRCAFSNTGSEAVLAAIRMARTVTGNVRLVTFAGHYHGIFDEVLVKGVGPLGDRRALPISPGIHPHAMQDVTVLDYGDPRSLEIIDGLDDLALVLVEPVRSRNPDLQPTRFVQQLRTLTRDKGVPMLFDEIVTGFRVDLGGAQALYGIETELASYGKVIGGGLPIGVIAGKADYLDALDGGYWQYGDSSSPQADMTWFAGTFVRHPLALASTKATLQFLKRKGPSLYWDLNERTADLCAELNRICDELNAPVYVEYCSSWFMIKYSAFHEYSSLLYYYLHLNGVYVYEGRPAFLTLAHSQADCEQIADAFRRALRSMLDAGFFEPRPSRAVALQPASERVVRRAVVGGAFDIPLSDGQQEIWLATRLGDDASCAFNLCSTVELRGPADPATLIEIIHELFDRHEALRAVPLGDGRHQRIVPELRIDVPVVEIAAGDTQAVNDARHAQVSTPFDLDHGPLVRASILRFGADHHLLLFTVHHIIADGWSCGLLLRDLGRLYAARTGAPTGGAEKPVMQLSEWVEWQNTEEQRGERAEAQEYWEDRFSGPLPVSEMPTDFARPSTKTFAAHRIEVDVDRQSTQRLRTLAAEQDTTLFTVLMAGWHAYVHRITGDGEIIAGFSAAGQAQFADRDLVSHCVNFLPILSQVAGSMSFASHLARVRSAVLDAVEHQNLTFGALLQRLPVQRDGSRLPLVSMAVNLDPHGRGIDFGPVSATPGSVGRVYENLDVFINWVEIDDRLQLQCTFNRDLFDFEMMRARLAQYTRLLQSAADAADTPIEALGLLPAEQQALLQAWNATIPGAPVAPDAPTDVYRMLLAQAEAHPDRLAVVYGDVRMTYGALAARATSIGRQLVETGVGSGDIVGLLVRRSHRMVELLFGIIASGAAYLPLDPDLPVDRLEAMLEDAQPKLLIADGNTPGARAPLPVTVLDAAFTRDVEARLPEDLEPDRLAYVIFTSGSTGRPKGVAVEHRSLTNLIESFRRRPGMPADGRMLAVTTLSFDISALELFLPLASGATVEIASSAMAKDPELLRGRLDSGEITHLQATPTTWRMLVNVGWQGRGASLHAWSGGEPLPAELALQLKESCRQVWNFYGPTETTVWSAIDRYEGGPVTIGRPIDQTTFHILDEQGSPVPLGAVGELCIGGRGVARGYLGRPALTEQSFITGPGGERLYRTGDKGRWRIDGRLECLGRLDRQIKIRGFRVEPEEIEASLRLHESVQDAAVVARDFGPGDRRLVAYVVRTPQGTTPDLRSFLSAHLPNYMLPTAFIEIDSVPTMASGKVAYNELPSPTGNGVHAPTAWPTTELEASFKRVFERTLGQPNVGVDDDFFAIGGHSLLGVLLVRELSELMGIDVPLQALYRAASVRGLAQLVAGDAKGAIAQTMVVPLNRPRFTNQTPLFCLCGVHIYAELARRLELPVYGVFLPVEAHLVTDGSQSDHPLPTVEEMARRYIEVIRPWCPDGPFRFVGISYGGVLAFEVARQLRHQGFSVEFVGLIDAILPSAVRRDLRKTISRQFKRIQTDGLRSWLENAITRVGTGGYDEVEVPNALTQTQPGEQGAELARIQAVRENAYVRAMSVYDRGDWTYEGDITLFSALDRSDFPGLRVDLESAWRRRISGSLKTHQLSGGHLSVLDEGHVDHLARWVRHYLEAGPGQ